MENPIIHRIGPFNKYPDDKRTHQDPACSWMTKEYYINPAYGFWLCNKILEELFPQIEEWASFNVIFQENEDDETVLIIKGDEISRECDFVTINGEYINMNPEWLKLDIPFPWYVYFEEVENGVDDSS